MFFRSHLRIFGTITFTWTKSHLHPIIHLHTKYQDCMCSGSWAFDWDGHTYSTKRNSGSRKGVQSEHWTPFGLTTRESFQREHVPFVNICSLSHYSCMQIYAIRQAHYKGIYKWVHYDWCRLLCPAMKVVPGPIMYYPVVFMVNYCAGIVLLFFQCVFWRFNWKIHLKWDSKVSKSITCTLVNGWNMYVLQLLS